MRVNRTSEWKVIAILISLELPLFNFERLDISWTSIIHLSQKLWLFEFSESFCVQFRGTRYMMHENRTSEWKVIAMWIFRELLLFILSILIYNRHHHTFDTKVMPVWICREHHCSISRDFIYDARELEIWVKSYRHVNFSRASVVQFWASQYIIGVDHTFESKVMAVWIYRELPCSISRVSIYYARESDIQVKSYSHLNFLTASVIQFWASRYIMDVDHTFDSKLMPVCICLVKCYDYLNFSRAFMFNFEGLDIWCSWIGHPSEKL